MGDDLWTCPTTISNDKWLTNYVKEVKDKGHEVSITVFK